MHSTAVMARIKWFKEYAIYTMRHWLQTLWKKSDRTETARQLVAIGGNMVPDRSYSNLIISFPSIYLAFHVFLSHFCVDVDSLAENIYWALIHSVYTICDLIGLHLFGSTVVCRYAFDDLLSIQTTSTNRFCGWYASISFGIFRVPFQNQFGCCWDV